MKTMTQALRASEALRAATDGGALEGSLKPAVFGCPYCHTVRIITSPLPLGRCGDCATPMAVLDAAGIHHGTRRAG